MFDIQLNAEEGIFVKCGFQFNFEVDLLLYMAINGIQLNAEGDIMYCVACTMDYNELN